MGRCFHKKAKTIFGCESMILFLYRLLAAIIYTALLGQPSWAIDASGEQSYFEEFPVVLSASRLKQPQSEAPSAMTVIDREMIIASGARNVVDILRLVPGMYVGYDSGNVPFASYHGATDQYARRMQVLIDGRTVYLPPVGGVDWLDIPLHIGDIERIEVIRGPAAASHGANSLQGVISIITRDAVSMNGASVALTQGNGGISEVTGRLGQSGDDLDYRLTLSNRSDHGYDLKIINDGSRTSQLNLRSNYRLNSQDSIDFQLGYSDGIRGAGNMARFNPAGGFTEPPREIKTVSDYLQIDWLHALSDGNEFKLNYYHISRSYLDNMPVVIDKQGYQIHRHELGLQHTLPQGEHNRLVWGANVRHDTADDPLTFRSPQALNVFQVFVHDEMRFSPSLLANLGAMYEDDGMGHRNWSPRATLNYHVTPEHTIRAGASMAYRSPVMFEQYADTSYLVSRPFKNVRSVNPEKIVSKEIGYLGEFKEAGISLDARIYQDRISDYIFLDPYVAAGPVLTFGFANLLAESHEGFESTLKFRWGERSNLVFNYAHQRVNCAATGIMTLAAFIPRLQAYVNQCSLLVPADSGSILLTQQLTPRLQFSTGYYHQEKVQVLDAQWPQNLMRRVDMRMAYTFGHQGEPGSGDISFVVQNAFQDNYTEYSNVPQKAGFVFNRRFYLNATLEL
jgi:iron complex outermembrane receptor protein